MSGSRTELERGSAVLEFLALGLVAQFAILAIALPALQTQRIQLAANSLAAQIARYITLNPENASRIQELVEQETTNYALDPDLRVLVTTDPRIPRSGQRFTVKVKIGSFETTDTRKMPR